VVHAPLLTPLGAGVRAEGGQKCCSSPPTLKRYFLSFTQHIFGQWSFSGLLLLETRDDKDFKASLIWPPMSSLRKKI
jgi:hypothetical protein